MSADPKRTPFRLPNGARIVVPPGAQTDARFIYAEIFDGRCYEQEGVTLAGSSVVLDVGANVGLFALRVLEAAPDARVLCFEPAPQTFACLADNAAPHPNIELHECALAHEPGVLTMTYFPRSPGNTSRHPELKLAEADAFAAHATLRWISRFDRLGALFLALLYPLRRPILRASFRRVYTGGVPFECRATTLDQIFGEQHIEAVDLLKVDVEGGEREVLAGLSDKNLARIRQLVVEITPAYKTAFIPEFERRLRDNGFTHVALRSMRETGTPASDVFPCTLFATRGDPLRPPAPAVGPFTD